MQLRNDFKYALIDEYCTYWDAYDDLNNYYAKIISSSPEMNSYLMSKVRKIVGAGGTLEKVLYSQNQLWLVYYANNKKTLMAMDDFKKHDAVKNLQSNTKIICRSTVVQTEEQSEEELTQQQ